MHFPTILASLAAVALPIANAASPYYKGFNVAANNPDGSCKTTAQWQTAFSKLQALPQKIEYVRLYASSDCNTLANAVPAALTTGTKILVGVWAEDSTHYAAEKQALLSAIQTHGYDWILAVSVGSEDLYRGDTTASTLAGQVNDVRGMIRAQGSQAEVGHVDTWTAWVNGANSAVITACDFLGMDGYPYFQDSSIEDAYNVFWQSVHQTQAVSQGKWVWVTETGWPVSGSTMGAAVPSLKNARTYWRSVACEAFKSVHIFWYVYQDYNESPSFGVFGSNEQPLYDFSLCS